jgi:AGZA family xanthine/uracil permease-like MFS transporter
MLERLFHLREAGTTVRIELIAGMTTFMTLSYIILVQPAVLATCGMDFGAVMMATCVGSAFATFLMGLLANYPIALAPAMGHNFYFAFVVCGIMKVPWQIALGANFIASVLFILLAGFRFREAVINAIPASIKNGIAVGIGLLITLVGMEWAGIVVGAKGTLVGLGNLKHNYVILSLFGILAITILHALKVRGAILWGIIAAALVGIPLGVTKFQGFISAPPSMAPTFMKLELPEIFRQPASWSHIRFSEICNVDMLSVVFVLFFLALFDTVGTLIGVSEQGGFMKDGKLPRAGKALLADAVGTAAGTLLGTSTVTSYIESAAGVSEGGKTGLANMVTGALMLLAVFFYPLIKMFGGGLETSPGTFVYPVIAPALIFVGSMIIKSVKKIDWDDTTEGIPAFLTMIMMPFSFGITEGIAFGFISYALLKLLTGRAKEAHWIVYVFSVLFVLRYIYLVR